MEYSFQKVLEQEFDRSEEVQHIVGEKVEKSRQSGFNDTFEKYYNVLHYIENLYLTQGNLDTDLQEYLSINNLKSDSQWESVGNPIGS